MGNKKIIPIGIDNFEDMMKGNHYYIDKSDFIKDVLIQSGKVKLFTRPRRFGKTLNMSMLKYFFDIQNSEINRKLFDGLAISKTEYMSEQGQYPVIYFSFKDVKFKTWEETYNKMKSIICNIYGKFDFVEEKLSGEQREYFEKIKSKKDDVDWRDSLKNLTEYLYIYYGKKSVILIDEYDNPIRSAYFEGYYDAGINFFRNFLSSVLKDNEYLEKGVLTGILRVAKEGIFSGLNNLMVNTVISNNFSEYFGLLEDEVIELLDYYKLNYELEEVQKWYNGYKFGEIQVYNPWSIMSYINERVIQPNWINVSDNKEIIDIIENSVTTGNFEIIEKLEQLLLGEPSEEQIYMASNILDLSNNREIWQLMLHSGYLTIKEKIGLDEYELKIPNEEVRYFFKNTFLDVVLKPKSNFREMIKNLMKKDIGKYKYYLQQIMLNAVSYHDIGREEKPYHNLLLGMILSLDMQYNIMSNDEIGHGRADLVLEPLDKRKAGFVFEFKAAKRESDFERLGKEALEQIKEKNYIHKMKENGVKEIILVGMVFLGKEVYSVEEYLKF